MAQDFMAAFGLGNDAGMIGFADAQGIAFAAIQAVNDTLEAGNAALREAASARDKEVRALRRELAALRRLVEHPGRTRATPRAAR